MSAVLSEHGTGVASTPQVTPAHLLQVAMDKGVDLDRLEKLYALQKQWEADEARKAYVAAMASFKAEPTKILKTKEVNIPGGAKFFHATLANVVDGVVASLSKFGLSHAWETKQDNGLITVTCIITHAAGHSERTTLFAAPDDSGKKNSIQQIGSTVTYLQRYTLMAACGLAAKDMDDDGQGAGKVKTPAEPAPPGYDNWKADMQIKAEEGLTKLMEAWSGVVRETRLYVVKYDDAWWKDLKAKAEKVGP